MKAPYKKKQKRMQDFLLAGVVLLLILVSAAGIDFHNVSSTAGNTMVAILKGIVRPDVSYIYDGSGEDMLSLLAQTLAIAFLGSVIASLFAFPLGFLAARTSRKLHVHTVIGKLIAIFIRTFPEIIMALIFIKIVGPGSLAGVLALGIGSIGMLSKFYSESVEAMDQGPSSAVAAAGANPPEILFYAKIPQLAPQFFSYSLYCFELSVRSATILGLVGAGGIGTPLIYALSARKWDRVGMIMIGIILMVLLVDFISGSIRKKLI